MLRSDDQLTADNEERNSNGWSIKRYVTFGWIVIIGHGAKNRLAEKRGGRDAARAKQIVANKKLIHGGELEGANT